MERQEMSLTLLILFHSGEFDHDIV